MSDNQADSLFVIIMMIVVLLLFYKLFTYQKPTDNAIKRNSSKRLDKTGPDKRDSSGRNIPPPINWN